jgi:hypothetical protein
MMKKYGYKCHVFIAKMSCFHYLIIISDIRYRWRHRSLADSASVVAHSRTRTQRRRALAVARGDRPEERRPEEAWMAVAHNRSSDSQSVGGGGTRLEKLMAGGGRRSPRGARVVHQWQRAGGARLCQRWRVTGGASAPKGHD